MDNMAALSYIDKMGGTHKKFLLNLTKEIWDYLLVNGIMVTIEYLPGTLTVEADHQSRSVMDSCELKLNPLIFKEICKVFCTLDTDLFASRIFQQVPAYLPWKPDPFSKGMDPFQLTSRYLKGYVFSPFCLIGQVLRKVQVENTTISLITPAYQARPCWWKVERYN